MTRVLFVLTAITFLLGAKPALAKAKLRESSAAKIAAQPEANLPTTSGESFIDAQTRKVLSMLKKRPVRVSSGAVDATEVQAFPSKVAFLSAVYTGKLVEASWATKMLSDKRIFSQVLTIELGDEARNYYPKTLGLKEFLKKHSSVNAKGEITASGDEIEEALFQEFPAGFVVRPAVGVAPQEKGKGLFPDPGSFIVELLKPKSVLYQPEHARRAVQSHILDGIASGEAVVLQENIVGTADANKPLKARFFHEVRVHTYEGQVVVGAVPARWVQTDLLSEQQVSDAEKFVDRFLKALPTTVLTRQAWGIDVAVMDNGEMRINDVVTNRGERIAWSSYLEQPRVIAAYARLFDANYGLKFEGVSGILIRNGFANYLPYWEKRIEKARPGLAKALAYLPPMP